MSVSLFKEGDYVTVVRGGSSLLRVWRTYKITNIDNGLNHHVKAPCGFRAVFTEDDLEDMQCRLATKDELREYFMGRLDYKRAKYDEKIARIKATTETLE